MAQSGHPDRLDPCPLLGVKRTSNKPHEMSAYDPSATSAARAATWLEVRPRPHSGPKAAIFTPARGPAPRWRRPRKRCCVLGNRQLCAQPYLQTFNFGRRQLADCKAGRSFRDPVRLPEFVEAGIGYREADHARLDRLQAGLHPERLHGVAPRDLSPRHRDSNAEGPQGSVHGFDRKAASRQIPHVGCNQAAGLHHVYETDWHNPPQRLLVLWLTGEVEFETSDGDIRRLPAGSVVLAEDTTGKGHITRHAPEGQLVVHVALA